MKFAEVIWASPLSEVLLKVLLSFWRIPIRATAMPPTRIGRMMITMMSSTRVRPASSRHTVDVPCVKRWISP
jgi:hypothetical protein